MPCFYYRQEKSGNGEKGFAERQVVLCRDFTSIQSEVNKDYEEMAELMISLAKKQSGFLGVDSALSNGIGITVSYWETEESIRNWKNHEKHLVARHKGRSGWYSDYHVRITQVEREYEFDSRKKMK